MSAVPPFEFKDCAMIAQSTGKSAHNLREMRERIGDAPIESLLHHFHETLLRPSFDDPEYPNDFSLWARRSLHDATLAERLAIVDTFDFEDVEGLRAHLLDVIEERLAEIQHLAFTAPGHEFRFLRSQLVIFSTEQKAETPEVLAHRIAKLSSGTIFYHFVDARRRNPGRVDDFTLWLSQWEEPWRSIGDRLRAIGFHHGSLTEIRDRIVACLGRAAELQRVP